MTTLTLSSADRSACPARFEIRVQPDRDVVYVEPRGELDLATCARLRDDVTQLLAAGFTHMVIDLRGLRFIDCAGLRLLLALHRDAQRVGSLLSLIQGDAAVRRLFVLTATLDALPFVTAPPYAASRARLAVRHCNHAEPQPPSRRRPSR